MKPIAAAISGLLLMASPALAADPAGTWLSADGGSKVRIVNCGASLCGTVVWLKEPVDKATGKPKTDKDNPDTAKRNRPMLGLQVIQGMRPNGADTWSGQIYNADDGKTYRSNLMLQSPKKARVEGCVLIFCIGENWTRTD
jgi:uncharacterized protein (DUF2147 family)